MSLEARSRLGAYEIVSPLGAGGMGEVYRARDTKLGRDVAIKILPASFASDPERVGRFRREAQILAALNHPHIAAIYGLEESGTTQFLVLELVEGEMLAERLARPEGRALPPSGVGDGLQAVPQNAIPVDEALSIARQVAEALEAAHEKGIIHRDLKPANIALTADGQVKVLDFGLAKALDVGGASELSHAPTLTFAGTQAGVILGTAAYMSPEQAKGRVADKRTDVWAFGCVLFEMLTGRRAFEGEDVVDTIGAVTSGEPDWKALPADIPGQIQLLLKRCLEKDRRARVSDIGVARFLMSDTIAPLPPAPMVAARVRVPRRMLVLGGFGVVASIALTAIVVWVVARRAPPAGAGIQFTIPAPENSTFQGPVPLFAISPDGRHIVFVATTASTPMLFLRSLESVGVKPLAGTEQATYPFWSPDSRSVGFFAAGKLKKVAIAGGAVTNVCDAASARGGTWNQDNTILFASDTSGPLHRVSAAGGVPAAATTVDRARGETTHRWPHFLPDGRHFLYVAVTGREQPSELRTASLDGGDPATIVASESMAVYASGHLFFWRDGSMFAQLFDPEARRLQGDAFSVASPVGQAVGPGYVSFSVSETGVMVSARGAVRPVSQLTWRDRSGKLLGTVGEAGDYFNIALSPDERRVAVTLLTGTLENRDIWLIDLARSVRTRLTFDPASEVLPLWSPDGTRVAFGSSRPGASGVYMKNADGSGAEELLMRVDENTSFAVDWSRDGRYISYYNQSPKTGYDLWILPMDGDRKPFVLLQSAFNEDNGTFAPDGRWIAYTSNESGRDEVYVQPFPGTGAKYQVSRSGGTYPTWRGDGRELFFLAPDGMMMATAIQSGTGFDAGIPEALFASSVAFSGNRHQYAVTQDGQRFLVNVPQERSAPTPLTVVVNWQAAIPK